MIITKFMSSHNTDCQWTIILVSFGQILLFHPNLIKCWKYRSISGKISYLLYIAVTATFTTWKIYFRIAQRKTQANERVFWQLWLQDVSQIRNEIYKLENKEDKISMGEYIFEVSSKIGRHGKWLIMIKSDVKCICTTIYVHCNSSRQ